MARIEDMNSSALAQKSCCSPPAAERVPPVEVRPVPQVRGADDPLRRHIPGGYAQVGTSQPIHSGDGESPKRQVRLQSFRLDECAVTNQRFARFVEATGYVTEAERFGWSFVFFDMLDSGLATQAAVGIEWWRRVDGACWRLPEGEGSSLEGRDDHPVAHVSWHDAQAFAAWAGGRLPTEAEWEHAARGGRSDVIYPWGDEAPNDVDFLPCNIWQGEFPRRNLAADGHRWLAPARSFEANGYGLYNMVGNAWEWTADAWRVRSLKGAAKTQNLAAAQLQTKVMKGGSFLCHASYCHRYRIAARHGNTPDTSTSHISFRLAYDAS